MRILAAALLVVSFAALLGARYLDSGTAWYVSLYALPLACTLFAVALASALLEYLVGLHFRTIAPVLALVLSGFCLAFSFIERAPGTLPAGLPLADLGAKAFSVSALGAGVAGLALGLFGLRSPHFPAQLLAVTSVSAAAFAFRGSIAAAGVPFLSGWSLGLLSLSLAVFVVSAWMRRRGTQPPAE
jgi:hypothetical protein